ncbi:hypothetical protein [Streptomyces sp. NPDC003077]|uniref:hypothetical protein n=1 Tax=Streptomyces sp. NPDC003077 TaxID=3154443 RepID=UPI0033B8B62B
MRLIELIEWEISRQDWAAMRCGCGDSAEHLAPDLLRLADDRAVGEEANGAGFEEHVWSPVLLWEPAPAVTTVALAALADPIPPEVRHRFLDLLQHMVAGEGTDAASARRGLDLPERCRALARQGLWLLYEEVASGRSVSAAGTAFEILSVVEPDRERLRGVREAAGELLPVCCRTGLCDDW